MKKFVFIVLILLVGCSGASGLFNEDADTIEVVWYDDTVYISQDPDEIAGVYEILNNDPLEEVDGLDDGYSYIIRLNEQSNIQIFNGRQVTYNNKNYMLTEASKEALEALLQNYLPDEETIAIDISTEKEEVVEETILDGYELVGRLDNEVQVFYKSTDTYFKQVIVDEIVLVKAGQIIREHKGQLSLPVISPDKSKYSFIEDVGFEAQGTIRLYTVEEEQTIVSEKIESLPETSRTVKNAVWYDNDHLLLVIGFNSGTISQGGDIYRLNIDTGITRMIIDSKEGFEIVDVSYLEPDLTYEFVQWTDNTYVNFDYGQVTVNLEEVWSNLPIIVE